MMYDDRHLYINGESFSASGEDAQLMRELANRRCLEGSRVGRLSTQARLWLADWVDHGWAHVASGAC
jgi:50S ribosomal protein L16 3-hydroxylase